MSCLTAPPLVSLLSLSRVQSQINSRLFLTLTYPSTCLHLQLAPRFSLFPTRRSSPLRGPVSPGAARAARPRHRPALSRAARPRWALAAGTGG